MGSQHYFLATSGLIHAKIVVDNLFNVDYTVIMNLRDAAVQAHALMKAHGLINRGWKLVGDDAVRRGGHCHYVKKEISLSRHFIELNEWDGPDGVKNLVLHEIAHALAPRGAHHGPAWRQVAQSIGCTGERCHAAKMPPRRFTYGCPNGHEVRRHRQIRNRPLACSKCCNELNGGKFTTKFLLTLKGK